MGSYTQVCVTVPHNGTCKLTFEYSNWERGFRRRMQPIACSVHEVSTIDSVTRTKEESLSEHQ
jgi:hypothetical protein